VSCNSGQAATRVELSDPGIGTSSGLGGADVVTGAAVMSAADSLIVVGVAPFVGAAIPVLTVTEMISPRKMASSSSRRSCCSSEANCQEGSADTRRAAG
jgi:hypothetical protein